VSGITDAVSLAAGDAHTCAVLASGSIKCWGGNTFGQLGNGTFTSSSTPVTVPGISTATAAALGSYHSCVRLSDSTLKCWGNNSTGRLGNGTTRTSTTPVAVTGITTATAIGSGGTHSCARLSDSTVKCWGGNNNGQLGNGTTNYSTTPVAVTGITTATAISIGFNHTCARSSNSTVQCWGNNARGQLGNNATTTVQSTPVAVSGLTTATGIGLGSMHSCARLSDSTLKCWGYNDSGQLGNGESGGLLTYSSTPVAVTGVTGAVEVSGGGAALAGSFTCALLSSGAVQCWGANADGELGVGTASVRALPVLVQPTTLNLATDVVGGADYTCVLWNTGAVKCWGQNGSGQLGNGTTTSSGNPVDVIGITNATALSAGYGHTCARLADSTVKCWGENSSGQLGNGNTTDASTPVAVSGISSATGIGLGSRHSCARLGDSTLRCWGRNANGELGNGSTTNSSTPVTVSGISDAAAVFGGGDNAGTSTAHTCALLNGGGVKCWGRNNYGQLGTGNTTNSTTPVQVSGLASGVTGVKLGMHASCALMSDGSVKCWGRNNYGQLGDASTTQRNSPVTVSGISTATALGGGGGSNHVCAVLNDKSVKCWGLDSTGQLGNATTTNSSVPVTSVGAVRAVAVATGGAHTCARRDDSTLMCWGSEDSGQLATGHLAIHATAVSLPCQVVEVERSDYFVNITTANMPDPTLNGRSANIDAHRVQPFLFPESCSPTQAALLVHGRTVEGVSAFDLQFEDYSIMESLAFAGIDSFTFNHLGVGRSSGLDMMSNACNASLPSCLDIGHTCPPPVGVLCDCGPAPTFGVNDRNQQGSTRYLNPNPLSALCAHTTNTRFSSTTTMVAELDAVVDDVLAKSGLAKVNLLGYSAGGIDVGNYLGEANATIRGARTAKVERAIFVSSLFGLPQVTAVEPTGDNAHTFPMGLMDRASATAGGFNLGAPTCPGQRDDNIIDPIWASVKARDTTGAGWGPSQTPAANGGLSRFPHATRWGWDATAAARVTVPVLVMQGLKDNVVPVASSANLYSALTGTSSKTIVQVACGSHSIFWEGCSGSTCNGWNGPHQTIRKNVQDWIKTGMIYASPGSANGSFASTDNDGANYHTDAPTSDGPPADEGNMLP
jgi:alpha-tubulin suppressor-like RCC1 family protein/pimeloyl-ACP methyl ester carboxylesterase